MQAAWQVVMALVIVSMKEQQITRHSSTREDMGQCNSVPRASMWQCEHLQIDSSRAAALPSTTRKSHLATNPS